MLEKYKKKRNSEVTPEPFGGHPDKEDKLTFVIQKHQASRLHYDFRLEMDGVLKSWAVPKGPSLNPHDKRLAMMVEDHPFDYKDFEGVIPKGNYGAGTVMVWDSGVYQPLINNSKVISKKEQEKILLKGLEDGHITFILKGKKLKGEFALIKLRNSKEPNAWLLVKADKDGYVSEGDITLDDKSVKSNRSLEEIAKGSAKEGQFWTEKNELSKNSQELLQKTPKSNLPKNISPMKATLIDEPFNDKEWSFEVKWDGYRAITTIENGNVGIYSRNQLTFNDKFPELYNAWQNYQTNAVFDGEIVSLDDEGRPNFQMLQDYLLSHRGKLVYYVFDLLYFEGHDLSNLTLIERRQILKEVLPKTPNILFSDEIREKGVDFFKAAKANNLEGIIAKKLTSTYQFGKRSKDWLKIKNIQEQEFVIGGFTKPRGARSGFGALMLGVYRDGQLHYVSNVGTGFDEKLITFLFDKFQSLIVTQSPFSNIEEGKDVTWLEPKLVCQVKFQEWTVEGGLRQPVFLGLREDKDPKSVIREISNG